MSALLQRRSLLDWLDAPSTTTGVREWSRETSDWELTTHAELAGRTLRIAGALDAAGLERNDTVLILAGRATDFLPAFMGCLAAGCTPAPAPTPLTFGDPERYRGHLGLIADASGARAILVSPDLAAVADEALGDRTIITVDLADALDAAPAARRALPDTALLQFTSGSTGAPKGVVVPTSALEANLHAIVTWGEWTDGEDALGSWLPAYHDMGLIGTLLVPTVRSADLWYLAPIDFVRSPGRWLEAFQPGRATITASPTFGFGYAARRVRDEEWAALDLSQWRIAIVAAERVDPVPLRRFLALAGPRGLRAEALAPAYGLAENTLAASFAPVRRSAPAIRLADPNTAVGARAEIAEHATLTELLLSPDLDAGWLVGCGAPVDGTQIHATDAEGQRLPEGTFGDLTISGTSLARAYRRRGAGDEVPLCADGHATGDAGLILDGEIYVIGRIGDALSINGRNHFAEDIDARVIATLKLGTGKVATALGSTADAHVAVVLADLGDAVSGDDVARTIRGIVGPGVRIVIVATAGRDIPRTSSGKPRRSAIFARWRDGDLDDPVLHDSARTEVAR